MLELTARILRTSMLGLSLLTGLTGMSAAQSVDDVLKAAEAKTGEVNRVLRALQNSDQITQYGIVEALLNQDDPALLRIGREHALFSTNPVLQNMGIVSAINRNPQLRLVLSNPDSQEALKWAEYVGGASDGQTAFAMLETGDNNGACWIQARYNKCRFTVLGTSVQFQNHGSGTEKNYAAQASLMLGPDGVLRGPMFSPSGRAVLSIDLKE